MKVEVNASNRTIKIYETNTQSRFWSALYLLFSVSIILFFLYLLYYLYLSEFLIPAIFIVPMTIAAGVLAFTSISLLTIRITITDSSIQYHDILKSKQIAFCDIKGFRLISTAQKSDVGLPGWEIEIESTNQTIIAVPKSIKNQEELIIFMRSKFMNLDEHTMKVYLRLKSQN